MMTMLLLQLRNVLMIYWLMKCIYANFIMHKRYSRYQIDNLYGALLLILVDGSGGNNNPCFLTSGISFHSISMKIPPLDLD